MSAGQAQRGQRGAVADRDKLADGLMRAQRGRAGRAQRGAQVVKDADLGLGPDEAGRKDRAGAGFVQPVDRVDDARRIAE